MSYMQLLQRAKDAALAGNLDEARTLREQATEIKAIDALTVTDPTPNRLPMGEQNGQTAAETSATNIQTGATKAIEAAYVKKFGSLDDGVDQIYRELYGTASYPMLRAAKMADVNRYLRTNHSDPRYTKMVLLAPEQIIAAIVSGVDVSSGQYNIKATMVEAQDTLGGVLVPEEINQDMVQRLPGMTVVRARARKFNTSRDALSFLVRTGGNSRYIGNIRSKMTSESPTATYSTNATFGKLIIPVHVNLSKVPVSKSLLEDSSMDIMSQVLMPEFATEAAIKEDQQFLTGTGADEPQGILRNDTTGGPYNADTLTQNSGVAADISFDAVVKAPWKLNAQYRNKRNPNVAFAFNAAVGANLASLKDSTGAYLWTEMHGANAQGNPDTLRGWAYAESEALGDVGANNYPIIFGDWNGYRIVDRIGMSVERYSDASTAETDSVVFFCRRRYGGQVAEGYKFVTIKCASPIN